MNPPPQPPAPARERTVAIVGSQRELLERIARPFLSEARGMDPLVRIAMVDDETAMGTGKADGWFIALRYLDAWSIKSVRAIIDKIPQTNPRCIHVLVCRPAEEAEFKMSCPACGQKLWVRDQDAGRGGRCPQCKRSFTLPDPETHARLSLALEQTVDVSQIVLDDISSARAALKALSDAIAEDHSKRHSTTTRVQVSDTQAGGQQGPTPTP